MAREKVAKAEIDPEAEAHAPRTREEVVQHYRQRRETEPAHTPFETDDEAGNLSGRYAGQPLERDESGRPRDPAREATRPAPDPADVPAGPGDAGAQSSPRVLPEDQQRDRGGWGRVAVVLGSGAVIVLLMVILL
jgi:hypothetical protein